LFFGRRGAWFELGELVFRYPLDRPSAAAAVLAKRSTTIRSRTRRTAGDHHGGLSPRLRRGDESDTLLIEPASTGWRRYAVGRSGCRLHAKVIGTTLQRAHRPQQLSPPWAFSPGIAHPLLRQVQRRVTRQLILALRYTPQRRCYHSAAPRWRACSR
jgi:hypothetical protein